MKSNTTLSFFEFHLQSLVAMIALASFLNCGCGNRPNNLTTEAGAKTDNKPKVNLPPRAQLTGTVHLPDGTPLPGGTVRLEFVHQDPGIGQQSIRVPVAAGIDSQGSFFIGNLPLGETKVVIETISLKMAPGAKSESAIPADVQMKLNQHRSQIGVSAEPPPFVAIHHKYGQFEKTPLTVNLREGKNHVNFVVEKQ